MTQLMLIITWLIDRIIYVWGASGQNVYIQTVKGAYDPEGWIKQEETSSVNANRAIALYRAKKEAGAFPLFAMDCSGFICYVLKLLGILKPTARYNTKGLYSMCNSRPSREELKQGDLVFHARKPGDVSTIHHVGIYLGDGKVAESRGRDAGGCITDFDAHPADWDDSWNMYGRLNKMEPFVTPPSAEDDEPIYPDEPLPIKVCKPVLTGAGYAVMQDALNSLGYGPVDIDGKWGKKSQAAFESAVRTNIGAVSLDGTLHVEGVGDIKLTLKEDDADAS